MFELQPSPTPRLAIHLLPRDEGLTVRVVSPAGDTAEKHTRLQRVEDVLRIASQPGFHEDVGAGLFRALLPGPLADLYRAAYTQAALNRTRLTIDLHIDPALVRLARYPWELLHDGGRFVLQSGTVNLVRTLDFPEPLAPFEPRGPLDVLVAPAQPDELPELNSIYDALDEALRDRIRDDTLDLAPLFPPTWDALMDWLLAGAPDVLHFEGHGDFTRTGRLLFEDERGGSDAVDAETLGAAFYSTRLRLVALSASDDARPGDESLLNSVAPTLIRAGIPAVVAMQRCVPSEIATTFWAAFYTALLDGDDLEAAVLAARQSLRRTTYWHAITLYRRAVPTAPPGPDTFPVRPDTAAPDRALVGWTVRAALWLRRPDVPPPAPELVDRLIGVPLAEPDALQESSQVAASPALPALQPGPVTVRLSAPCCVVHDHAQRTHYVSAEDDMPPLWFALTPRQPGEVTLTFDIVQQDRVVAAVTHPMRITEQPAQDSAQDSAGDAAAVLVVHGARPAPSRDVYLDEHDSSDPAMDDAAYGAPDLPPAPDSDENAGALLDRVPPGRAGNPLERAALPPLPPARTTRRTAREDAGVPQVASDPAPHGAAAPRRVRFTVLLLVVLVAIVIAAVIALLVL